VEKAKRRLISKLLFQREKASAEANDIAYSFTHDIKDYYYNYEKRIEEVSLKDIKELASDIFSKKLCKSCYSTKIKFFRIIIKKFLTIC